MKKGPARFGFYLDQVEQMLKDALKDENPALWLYKKNARTPLFMLEGLARLYSGLHNKNRFVKIKEQFKILEDGLGAIDYYDFFSKEFAKDERVPANVREYMQTQLEEKTERLNDILKEHEWLGPKAGRLKKIRDKISGADWMKPEEEAKVMEKYYLKSIKEIKTFATESSFHYTEVETQVHSLRRKLRWLSIYTIAMRGAIQLTDSAIPDEQVNKYLTPEIINSPFSKLPEIADNNYILLLEKNYFFALSWIVEELGKLKDSGHKLLAISESLQQTESLNQQEAMEKTLELLNDQNGALNKILDDASIISRQFFEEGNIDKLVQGTVSAKKMKKNF